MNYFQYAIKKNRMKIDKLKQYVALRDSLLDEKAQLEARLEQINKALGKDSIASVSLVKPVKPAKRVKAPVSAKRKRAKNPMSLKEAVRKVTSERPMTKKEILSAIQKLGYRFSAADPMNSLNVVLYTKGLFRNDNGKFSPAK